MKITNRAAAELNTLISPKGKLQPAIRIYIIGSSTDAQYGLAVADGINDYHVTMENSGINIVIHKDMVASFSDGSIDFVADKTGKNFIIQNVESGTRDNCEECNIRNAE